MHDLEHDEYVYPGKRFTRSGYVSGEGQGISLRDWFAGQAIAAMGEVWAREGMSPDEIAAAAYDHADAMLAARKDRPHD